MRTVGQVRIPDLTDGLSNTALFRERSHVDPNNDAAAASITPPSGQFITKTGDLGWWANSGGRLASGDVTMSAFVPLNYRVPAGAPATYNEYFPYYEKRVNAFGSQQPAGRTLHWRTAQCGSFATASIRQPCCDSVCETMAR